MKDRTTQQRLIVRLRKAMLGKDYPAIKRLTGLEDGQFATNHIIFAYEE